MSKIVAIQEFLRPALPKVKGCKDYEEEKKLLERVDRILVQSGVEEKFLELSVASFEANVVKLQESGQRVRDGSRALERYERHSRRALRCTVLKGLIGGGYRRISKGLAMTPLYRWFCGSEDFDVIRVPGKSTLQDYAHWLPANEMEQVLGQLARALGDENEARLIGLENELDMAVAWVDTSALKACVHFPTDWVLMRDAVRTLVKSILTIRRHGLRRRIPEPESFLRKVNTLSMAMSAATRRKPKAKKERKRLVRALKRVSSVVQEHGRRYRDALDKSWEQTDLTRKEAEVILRRMDNVLAQLPEARRQAHERIIAGRKVSNAQKILSLYERDIHVIVRGKAGADVEFGNTLYLAETSEGFILDHQLLREASPGDAQLLRQRYAVMKQNSGGQLCAVAGDRSFESAATRRLLQKEGAFDALCPRNPATLCQRIQSDEAFSGAMRRRGQTEARIAILKNVILEGLPRAKGFKNRQLQVAWAVLAHNLWVLARQPWRNSEPEEALAA